MTDLQKQAETFLKRDIPPEIRYAPGSITEILLADYAEKGRLDAEGYEMLSMRAMESHAAVDRHQTAEATQFFHDCADILDAILREAQ